MIQRKGDKKKRRKEAMNNNPKVDINHLVEKYNKKDGRETETN
jgi:hypothetical protein